MTIRIINADVLDGLKGLPDESVNAVVTSPPYFGLRNYGVDGQIGLEPTPSEFVDRLVDVFREVKRVLRSDGSCWINMGDTYAANSKGSGGTQSSGLMRDGRDETQRRKTAAGSIEHQMLGDVRQFDLRAAGVKAKDLIGVPWMMAFAIRADGWWLRSANVWAKPNGMPESTRDRPTVGHEYVFQFTKSSDYYYGYDDVRLPPVPESVARLARAMRHDLDSEGFVISGGGYAPPGQPPHQGARKTDKQRGHSRRHAGFNDRWDAKQKAEQQSDGAALRSVWWIAPGGFADAHFATMPEELAALLVLAGCPKGGTVLDPFGGAGTTALVADRLQRNAILIELNPEYAAMAESRINGDRGGLLDLMEAAQ
jgi:DNA modification methylase